MLLGAFWPWWLGGIALAVVAVGFYWVARRPLAVSGAYARFLAGPSADRALPSDPDALEAALLAATLAQFPDASAGAAAAAPASSPALIPTNVTWSSQTVFLLSVFVGAGVAAMLSRSFAVRADLGPDFVRLIGSGAHTWGVLLFGGVLVGFGTRMAGGCTSGHGLSGCGRLQPGSLVATASFFGAGVATSFLLEAIAR